ncbi:hypothetical protein V8F33_002236 [Rhypophila sp. PSN 637]
MISHQSLLTFLSWTIFTLFAGASAQQFADGTMDYSIFENLSPLCQDAVNTTISCHSLLSDLASPSPTILFLNSEELVAVCATGCRSSLTSLRSQILLDCSEPTDVMVDGTMAYPATYFVDRFLHAHDCSCFKDQLGLFASQLSSPFEYADALADEFTSLTASCGASGYSFTSPAPYGSTITITRTIQLPEGTETASVATSSTPPNPTPACNRPYTVQPGDTCISISEENQVSTYGLIHSNNIDSCSKVVEEHEIDMIDWLTWNPIFDSYCTNAGPQFTNWTMCVSPPGGALSPPPVPSAATSCTAWVNYEGSGLSSKEDVVNKCWYVAADNNIRLGQLLEWNPPLDTQTEGGNCTLSQGFSYCVGAEEEEAEEWMPIGDANSTSSAVTDTTSNTSSVSHSTTTNITTTTTTSTTTMGVEPPAPIQPGIIDGCTAYNEVVSGDGCWAISNQYGIDLSDFYLWNPGVGSECENLWLGYAVCVGI